MSFINPRHTPLFDPEDVLTSAELAFIQDLSSAAGGDATAIPIIFTGTASPTTTPSVVGDIFVDTTNNNVYIATGTSTSADWTEVTGGGAGGGHTIQDEGVSLTQRTNLNFVGSGVTVTDDSPNNTTLVTISTGSGVTDGDKGDITVSGGGATWTIDNGVVSLAKQADMATASVVYRKTAGTGAPEVQTLATLKTDLGLTGTNSGDQTSIVGITGTKAEFDTAITDGNFLYVGDITQYTDELAQDAVGTILVDSAEIDFTYNDVTPSITASIIASSIDETKLDVSVNASLDLADTAVQPNDPITDLNATAHRLFYSDVSGNITELAFGTSGLFLKSQGATTAPTWDTPAGGGNTYFNNWRFAQSGTSNFEALTGTINGSNTTFTVPGGAYVAGKLFVYLNNIPYTDGITETTPASGIFNFDTAPTTGDIVTVFFMDQDVSVNTVITTATVDEYAQDAVGTILTDSTEIDFTYNDVTPSITASLIASSIDETKLDASVNASLNLADTALQNIVEDLTPQLGGELDANGQNITGLSDITFKTGAIGGTIRTGTSNADKIQLQAYDVDGVAYQKVLQVDAGNTPTLEVFTNSFAIFDSTDETKKLNFSLSGGTTGVATTMTHTPTANRVITFPDATDTLIGKNTIDTLTNKRINLRTSSTATTATLTPSLATANVFYVTAQTTALTIAAPTGTPVIGEIISINIKDNATSQTLTFNATFKFMGTAAPTATTISKWSTITAQYNGTDWLTVFATEV